ncbi:MAG: periplasmic heavy metal sensor [Pseudomonadota bacterium]
MEQEPQSQTKNWLRLLLIGSVALNFVFIGLATGIVLNAGKKGSRLDDISRVASPVLSAMTPEMRGQVRTTVFKNRAELRAIRRSIESTDDDILAALRTQPFDVAAFQSAIEARRSAIGDGVDAVNKPVSVFISQLTDDERAALADKMEERRKKGRGFGLKKNKGEGARD